MLNLLWKISKFCSFSIMSHTFIPHLIRVGFLFYHFSHLIRVGCPIAKKVTSHFAGFFNVQVCDLNLSKKIFLFSHVRGFQVFRLSGSQFELGQTLSLRSSHYFNRGRGLKSFDQSFIIIQWVIQYLIIQ